MWPDPVQPMGSTSNIGISNSYTLAKVSGGTAVGGLLADYASPGSIRNSYWNRDIVDADSRNRNGEGKTTAELQSPTGYTGIYSTWDDGGDVWDFGTGSQYPALKADINGDGIATAGEFGIQHGRTPDPSCTKGSIALDDEITGRWMGHCGAVSRPGSYALYYTLALATESEVIITLESDDADTYLFLLEGSGISGSVLHKDDDYIGGGTNSRIHETLAAGTYTIEAATYGAREPGSFSLTVEPGQGTPREPSSHCVSGVPVDGGAVSGAWANDCPSVNKEGSYARYYAFSLSEETEVSITLESDDADTYLFLLEDFGTSGAVLHKDDDYPGGGTDSQVKETLPGGVYTIEATTYDEETTGGFTLTIREVVETVGPPGPRPPPSSDACGENLSGDDTVNGTWDAECESETRDGRYARYYTFTLAQERDVTVTLRSSDADAYLYLREGDGVRSGAALNDHADDDDAGGGTDAQAEEMLSAGTYTIEATTHGAGVTSSFTLTVSGLGGGGTPVDTGCLETVERDGTFTGEWTSDCESGNRSGSYARYYTFTLNEEKDVTIILESDDADTYLNLLSGAGMDGSILHDNDDAETGNPDSGSRIAAALEVGTYTVEATTYYDGDTGNFTLSISGL